MDKSVIELHIERLKETVQEVFAAAQDFPAGYVHHKPDEVAFSATEIIYHLNDVEALWQRRIGMLRAESVAVVMIDPDKLARDNNYNIQIFSQGIDEFSNARRHTFDVVRGLSPEQLGWTLQHPTFGEMNVEKMLSLMANHDLGHAAQFGRTRAALGI
jgi:uncharacterized damage-inducible protein DinB